jgi:hypothetical protein
MDKIVVSFGKKMGEYGERPSGISFVALSRVRCLEHLLINHENFDLDRLLSIKLNPDLKQFDRMTTILANETMIRYNQSAQNFN